MSGADRVRALVEDAKAGPAYLSLAWVDALEIALEALETILLGCPPEAGNPSTEHGADHQLAVRAIERMAQVLEGKRVSDKRAGMPAEPKPGRPWSELRDKLSPEAQAEVRARAKKILSVISGGEDTRVQTRIETLPTGESVMIYLPRERTPLNAPEPETPDRLREIADEVAERIARMHGVVYARCETERHVSREIHAALVRVVRETADEVSTRFGRTRLSNDTLSRAAILRHWGLKE